MNFIKFNNVFFLVKKDTNKNGLKELIMRQIDSLNIKYCLKHFIRKRNAPEKNIKIFW